jgi:2,4-dienoyl-CoA reductase-like NADH-dependent reductase (Old Yellow Enzyme family)
MSALFTTGKIGKLKLKNRFIHSATYEGMAEETGKVSDRLVKRYETLAKGDIGLIIPGYCYVHPSGKAYKNQTGIHSDDMIPGLQKITDAVHQNGSKIAFQIVHAGGQTHKRSVGRDPIGPSKMGRNPILLSKTIAMTEEQIDEVITAFGAAARRAVEAGADGVQIHAAHGYLVNQFLSPFFNRRTDRWGGADENRFRFIRRVVEETKKAMPVDMPLLVKLNTNDFTPKVGITPQTATVYAKWLAELNIDGLEVSCGTASYSFMNMCRGAVPAKELADSLAWWMRPLGKLMINKLVGKYDLEEGYNLEAAKMIKPLIGKTALAVVGGFRTKRKMEEIVEAGFADFLSMSRPFIREPLVVKRMKEGKADRVACESCNRCLAAVAMNMPVKCYCKGIPK